MDEFGSAFGASKQLESAPESVITQAPVPELPFNAETQAADSINILPRHAHGIVFPSREEASTHTAANSTGGRSQRDQPEAMGSYRAMSSTTLSTTFQATHLSRSSSAIPLDNELARQKGRPHLPSDYFYGSLASRPSEGTLLLSPEEQTFSKPYFPASQSAYPHFDQPQRRAPNVPRYAPGSFSSRAASYHRAMAVAGSSHTVSVNTTSSSDRSHSRGSFNSAAEKFGALDSYVAWRETATEPESDDFLHDLGPNRNHRDDSTGTIFTRRGLMNVGTLLCLTASLLMIFAGYPILVFLLKKRTGTAGGFNLGGINATGQVPQIPGLRTDVIDVDTPIEARTRMSVDGKQMRLVFSDEFNQDGRSFYPGDDPFWEAVNLHYWGTGNYEWYDPAAVTTKDGNLVISLTETPDHGLNFRGGMVTTWNKFCFTGGHIEVRVVLPGSPDVSGLWPAAWTMGNLGRAGYGATTDGLWPYTYDSCDVGTLSNQTYPASQGGGPVATETTGVYVDQYGPGLSYLPGQRLSRCTCPNSTEHPGPKHSDGTWVGRSAPEIDIIEAQASNTRGSKGHVSMSLQLAPFDSGYNLTTETGAYEFYDTANAELNTYTGSVYQQAASGLVYTKSSNYMDTEKEFDTYGFEYKAGEEPDSHITWTISGKPEWRLNAKALGPDAATEIGQRLIPPEPMYILLNLGISASFSYVNFDELVFPATYLVDYVRVWQPEDAINIGCDPPDFPTKKYIETHFEAYNNPNLTIWSGDRSVGGYGQPMPGNSMKGEC